MIAKSEKEKFVPPTLPSSPKDEVAPAIEQQQQDQTDAYPQVQVKVSPLSILLKILPYALSVFLVFAVTLGCFPAITVLVRSTDTGPEGSEWANTFFIPVACFVLFNVGDYAGR